MWNYPYVSEQEQLRRYSDYKTGWATDVPWFNSRPGQVVFLFYTGFIPALNITQLPVQWVLVVLFLHLVSKLKQHGDVPPFPTCFHTVSFDILHNVPDHLPISYPPFRYALTLRPSSYFRLIHHISVTSASFVLIKLSRLLEAHNMNYYASSNID